MHDLLGTYVIMTKRAGLRSKASLASPESWTGHKNDSNKQRHVKNLTEGSPHHLTHDNPRPQNSVDGAMIGYKGKKHNLFTNTHVHAHRSVETDRDTT